MVVTGQSQQEATYTCLLKREQVQQLTHTQLLHQAPKCQSQHVEVIANQQGTQSAGGYKTSSDELPIGTERSQCNRESPECYGNYISY